jgi:hypothetical protein
LELKTCAIEGPAHTSLFMLKAPAGQYRSLDDTHTTVTAADIVKSRFGPSSE